MVLCARAMLHGKNQPRSQIFPMVVRKWMQVLRYMIQKIFFETEDMGCFNSAHHPQNNEDDDKFNGIDIVAIHGLNGDVRRTWTHKNGTFWLQDLLPHAMPGARIFTYSYPSPVLFS